jgi:hypothetical protein
MTKKIIDIDLAFDDVNFDEKNIIKYTSSRKTSDTLKGKSLEQLLGPERAAEGKKIRAKNSSGPRPKSVMKKIVNTKKINGVYNSPNHGMNGKKHKESTKELQALKAQVRQDLKRKLGLGRNDSVPKDLLLMEYKKHGL